MGRRPRGLLGWAQGPVAARSITLGGGGLTSRPALLIRALADEPAGLLLAANTLFYGSHAHACSWGVCSRGPDRTCWSGGWGRALPPVTHPGRLSQARQPLRCC